MTLTAVAARYAHALADVVSGPSSPVRPEIVVAELRAFEGVLKSSHELLNALVTPAVAGARKKAVVGRIADTLQLSRISRNFLFVLIDHRRIASLSEILQMFEVALDERLGFARAEVTAARDLSEEQRRMLNSRLEQLTGKRIRSQFKVDESLIGGVVARIGSTIYDGSVRGRLHALGRRLSARV
jgi:F-type H+-transporting ATPase subunit delta